MSHLRKLANVSITYWPLKTTTKQLSSKNIVNGAVSKFRRKMSLILPLASIYRIYISTIFYIFILLCAKFHESLAKISDSSNNFNALESIEQLCADCRLTSQSVENLIRNPRQVDAYGQVEEKVNLEKIKKAVCKEIISDQERERCRNFYFSQQANVIKWKQSQSRISFHDFVCIKELKYCCPSNSYGPKCTKCPKCGINEHCHGDSTRTGNGSCVCREGHTGIECASCLPGYYLDKSVLKLSDDSPKRILCKACHRSCLYCRHESPQGCEVCKSGFTWVPGYGCSDIDECIKSKNKICGENTFCVNTEGSYFCYECDRACDGCHGDGPDMCLRCAKGYKLDNGNCVALKKTILPPEANYYRYAIYVGLSICTCIILHNNVYMAGLVGLAVSIYIGVSEYVMSGHPSIKTD